MTRLDELIIYREFEKGAVLQDMTWVMMHYKEETLQEEVRELFFGCMHGLIDLAGNYGFEKNLWHAYLTYLLVNNENVFSTSCEIKGVTEGSLLELAKHDFQIFRELFEYDFTELEKTLGAGFFEEILNYRRAGAASKVYNKRICNRICELSEQLGNTKNLDEFTEHIVHFYREFGVGKLGLHKAFRVVRDDDCVMIEPITNIMHAVSYTHLTLPTT